MFTRLLSILVVTGFFAVGVHAQDNECNLSWSAANKSEYLFLDGERTLDLREFLKLDENCAGLEVRAVVIRVSGEDSYVNLEVNGERVRDTGSSNINSGNFLKNKYLFVNRNENTLAGTDSAFDDSGTIKRLSLKSTGTIRVTSIRLLLN